MSWTEERIEKLTKMWEGGSTASQIADELGGVSRNAVIGKAHRLGLKARPSPVKANEKSEAPAAPAVPKAAKPVAPPPEPKVAAPRPTAPAPIPPQPAPRTAAPATPATEAKAPSEAATAAAPQPRIVSVGPGGFLRQGPGDQQAPIPPAPPSGPRASQPGNRRQDEPARSQRSHLPLADGPPGRARFPLLRGQGESRLPVLCGTLWPRLSGTVAARPSSPAAADAIWRSARALTLPSGRSLFSGFLRRRVVNFTRRLPFCVA